MKTWLIVKEEHLFKAERLFQDTGVNITVEGRRHLGGAIGKDDFVRVYVEEQVQKWAAQVELLAGIARTEPHAAYAAFRHGLSSRWTYLPRTVSRIGELFLPLDDKIRQNFKAALTGQEIPGDLERKLFALPSRMGVWEFRTQRRLLMC